MIDQQTSEYNSTYFVLCNKLTSSIQGSLRYPKYFYDLLSLSNFRVAPSGVRVKNHSILKIVTELRISFGNVFYFILPRKHVTCVFYYLVRSTCNLERV